MLVNAAIIHSLTPRSRPDRLLEIRTFDIQKTRRNWTGFATVPGRFRRRLGPASLFIVYRIVRGSSDQRVSGADGYGSEMWATPVGNSPVPCIFILIRPNAIFKTSDSTCITTGDRFAAGGISERTSLAIE